MTSNKPTNPLKQALENLRKYADTAVRDYPLTDQMAALKNQAHHLGVELDVTKEQLEEYLTQARTTKKKSERRGLSINGSAIKYSQNTELLPGLLLENRLNLVVAEQGIGKSVFCLGLFRSLVERTGEFLNLSLNKDKNYELYLIGPDMSADGWGEALILNRLVTVASKAEGTITAEPIKAFPYFSSSEYGDSLSPDDIERYREMAQESVGRGCHPIFVFDSYRALVANYKALDEIKAQFAEPLQNLQRRMTGIGATVIVLHHTSKSSTNTEKAGAGTNRLGAIPDVIVQISRLSNNPLTTDKRLVIESSKRINKTRLLIEQNYDTAEWTSHGDAAKYMVGKAMIEEIAKLNGAKHRLFDWAMQRWDDQRKGMTSDDAAKMLEVSVQASRNHLKWMEQRGLLVKHGSRATISKPSAVYYPYYAAVDLQQLEQAKADEAAVSADLALKRLGNAPSAKQNKAKQSNETPKPLVSTGKQVEKNETNVRANDHKVPELNADGQPVPRKGLMVDLHAGSGIIKGVIACDAMKQHDLTVAVLGNPDLTYTNRRWMADVFPVAEASDEI